MKSPKASVASWLRLGRKLRAKCEAAAVSDSAVVSELKTKYESAAAADRAAISELKKRVRSYELKNRFYEKRDYGSEIDAVRHNSARAMDEFFETVENAEPYITFGRALTAILAQHSIRRSGKTVLDWGVGPGIVLSEILKDEIPTSLTGYDFSEVALGHARGLFPEGKFEVRDIYAPQPHQFDLVLCTEVLEHLEHPEVALKNLFQATAASGILILTVPDGRIDYSRLHINFWSPESWRLFLTKNLPNSARIVVGTFRPYEDRVGQNNFAIVTAA